MRILVVEDEQRLAAGLRAGLEAEGFAVDVASNGVDGLWLDALCVAFSRFASVTTSVWMPRSLRDPR